MEENFKGIGRGRWFLIEEKIKWPRTGFQVGGSPRCLTPIRFRISHYFVIFIYDLSFCFFLYDDVLLSLSAFTSKPLVHTLTTPLCISAGRSRFRSVSFV